MGDQTTNNSRPTAPPAFANHLLVFGLVWLGQLISITGSSLTGFALGVWVLQGGSDGAGGSVTQFALISLMTTLPAVNVEVAIQCTQRTGLCLGQTHHAGVGQRHRQVCVALHQGRDRGSIPLDAYPDAKYALCQLVQHPRWRHPGTRQKKAAFSQHGFAGRHGGNE